MMIVWRGYGLAILLVVAFLAVSLQNVFEGGMGPGGRAMGASHLLAGVLLGGTGLLLNRQFQRPASHDSVMFIPILWWGVGFIVYGLYRLVAG